MRSPAFQSSNISDGSLSPFMQLVRPLVALALSMRAPAIRMCDTPPEGGWVAYEWWEDGQTCVEYTDGAGQTLLGVYNAYTIVESEPHIVPLCAADEDDGISCLFSNEEAAAVPLSSVTRILDPDYVFISERQAGGGQGQGNPHGEHGETVYDLRDVEISEDVTLILSEESAFL